MLLSMLTAILLGSVALAQEPDAPLDTQPLQPVRIDAARMEGPVRESGATTESFFAFDARARGRGRVVTTADIVLACAGAGALRDAAQSCPLDHQVALRGLPGLLESCSAIGQGGVIPTVSTPVPHAATIKAAADARVARSARLMQDCSFHLSAAREGAQLQVSVPASSGVVEVRVGWRRQGARRSPDAPLPPVEWLPPVFESALATPPGMVARTVDLGAIRPQRGWWRFDLAVEVVDEAGAATRVVMPVDIFETGVAGPVELGPSLEVMVGAGSANLALADLPIPPEPARDASTTLGRPGSDRTPSAGAGTDPSSIDRILDLCGRQPDGVATTTCRRLEDASGRPAWPPEGAGPIVSAAARDDLTGLLRRMGEALLRAEASSSSRSWVTEDAALVLAAMGGMLETMVRGADPISSLAAWSRQRGPLLPSGESFGFFADEAHRAAPMASTLYVASLVAASTPELVEGPGQAGVSVLTLASNLAWSENLPGGLRAPWSGTLHPRVGEADLGWLAAVAEAIDATRSAVAPVWDGLRRGGPEVVGSIAALYTRTSTAILHAAAGIPDQAGDSRERRASRRADLERLLGRLPTVFVRVVRGDPGGTADAALAITDDPALRGALPPPSPDSLAAIGSLATLASIGSGASRSGTTRGSLVGVVGVGIGPERTADGVAVVALPTAALAWQRELYIGRAAYAVRIPLLDVGAPWAWHPGAEAPMQVDWRSVFSPGVQGAWSPSPQALAVTAGLRARPWTTADGVGAAALRLELGLSRAVGLRR